MEHHLKSCIGNGTFELEYGTAESRTATTGIVISGTIKWCIYIYPHSLVEQ